MGYKEVGRVDVKKKNPRKKISYNINKNRTMLVNSVRSIEQRGSLG